MISVTRVTHNPRLAWDGAMTFAEAARFDDLSGWLAPTLGDLTGQTATRVRDLLPPLGLAT